MAKIIRDTKEVTDYYEDYRIAGYSTHIAEAYYCGNCKKEIKEDDRFCKYCGTALKGIQDKIRERQKKAAKPYEEAYAKIRDFRNTLDKESLEYEYLTDLLEDIHEDINYTYRKIK